MEKKIIKIFDTTLRDGEQSPGASMNVEEKIILAKQLARLGVDVIEAGFAMSSVGDFESIRRIAQEVEGPIICSLARAKPDDIDRAWEALKDAPRGRIHTFISTSDIHLKHQFRMTREEALKRAVEMVKRAKGYLEDVEFSPMDATRSEPAYLYEVLSAVIEAGATTLNIPDTVGYAMPHEFGSLIKGIRENVRKIDQAVISVHCHNDLGLAVANSLSAILNGAGQVECTINGIGERAGNASIEEVVMGLRVRKDLFGADTRIHSEEIIKSSRLLTRITGIPVQPNKAIVGANAFAHESGIHQDGLLKEKMTYEIMTPESVGLSQSKLVMGKHSGRHAFVERLKEIGFNIANQDIDRLFQKFKKLADLKKDIFDEDLAAIVEEEISQGPQLFSLDYIHTSTGNLTLPTATIRLKKGEEIFQDASIGDGPVDAAYKAIERITGISVKLVYYSIRAITEGEDAVGEVLVKVKFEEEEVISGRGTSTDIIEASVKAYLNALNKIAGRKKN